MTLWLAVGCWSSAGIGLAVAIRGGWFHNILSVTVGMCLTCYSLTGETYVRATDLAAGPLTTLERTWGATSAVLGGCACVCAMLTLRRREQRVGAAGWVDTRLQHQLLWAVLLATVSIGAINLGLYRYDLPPSNSFITDYGHLPGVVVYEVVFALWIMLPVGFVGWILSHARSVGPARWLFTAGGVIGVVWGAWKVAGVMWVLFADDRIFLEGPVSLVLGLLTLGVCMGGVLVCVPWFTLTSRRRSETYRVDRNAEDVLMRTRRGVGRR